MRSPIHMIMESILFLIFLSSINKAINYFGLSINYWAVIGVGIILWMILKNALVRYLSKRQNYR